MAKSRTLSQLKWNLLWKESSTVCLMGFNEFLLTRQLLLHDTTMSSWLV